MSDVRRVVWVVKDGALFQSEDLYRAMGVRPTASRGNP